MKLYQYFFYTLYRWALHIKTDKVPVFKALLSLVIIQMINIETLLICIEIYLKKVLVPVDIGEFKIVIIILVLLGMNYIILLRNGKLKKIIDRFKNEHKRNKQINQVLIGCYILLSFVLFFFLIYLESKTF